MRRQDGRWTRITEWQPWEGRRSQGRQRRRWRDDIVTFTGQTNWGQWRKTEEYESHGERVISSSGLLDLIDLTILQASDSCINILPKLGGGGGGGEMFHSKNKNNSSNCKT